MEKYKISVGDSLIKELQTNERTFYQTLLEYKVGDILEFSRSGEIEIRIITHLSKDDMDLFSTYSIAKLTNYEKEKM